VGQAGLLSGKRALILGVANDHSIAWGIARALHAEGATLGFASQEALIERRVRPLATSLGSDFIEACDVQQDADIERVFSLWQERHGGLDVLIHAVAFANRDELSGPYYNTSRAGFHLAMDISVYSFTALARPALPIMRPDGAMPTLSHLGAVKAVRHYNGMGVGKATLDASVRYLAWDLGQKNIRVNAISAGPVRTLAARSIAGFTTMEEMFELRAPLHRHIDADDCGGAAAYLLSDDAKNITGTTLYVDAGYHGMGM